MERVELAIIGGGLVGASLALALQDGARARGWRICRARGWRWRCGPRRSR